jgi:hypothetical protein
MALEKTYGRHAGVRTKRSATSSSIGGGDPNHTDSGGVVKGAHCERRLLLSFQRVTGLRTNGSVVVGSAMFIMMGGLIAGDGSKGKIAVRQRVLRCDPDSAFVLEALPWDTTS